MFERNRRRSRALRSASEPPCSSPRLLCSLARSVKGRRAEEGARKTKPRRVAKIGPVLRLPGGTGDIQGEFVADLEGDIAHLLPCYSYILMLHTNVFSGPEALARK